MTWQNSRRSRHIKETDYTLLMLEVPRTNDKKELAAEQMFAALHGILRPKRELIQEGTLQEHISFEIVSIGHRIHFYVWTPQHLQNFVEGQIYAQYPTVQIYEIKDDYAARNINQSVAYTTELTLGDNEVLPIKTFPNFEVDPLAGITATLAKLEQEDEELWIQILARPVDDSWHKKGQRFINLIKNGGGFLGNGSSNFVGALTHGLLALWRAPTEASAKSAAPELSERDRSRIQAVQEKTTKLGYQVKIRIVYLGNDERTAKLRMQAMIGSFKQFNSTNLNRIVEKSRSFSPNKLSEYQARFFLNDGRILNIEELASLYHLPHTSVETPNIIWATSKTAEPPATLPILSGASDEEISPFGVTNFRGSNAQFGLRRNDRGRHLYIIGQTGVGKSGLLELLTLSDVFHNQGFAVIDPHGDYATDILKYIPAHRINDVLYFNPADTAYPIGFNPLEITDESLKNHISSELVGVLKRMFESWGPRLEYILRYTILALLDHPNTTMLDITRMLTEKDFRAKVIRTIDDPVVRNFWVTEFASWNDKFAAEAVAPVLNKVGAFTANPMIRNIVGQSKSSFNIRKIMDEGKILIVNLSRGLVGEDNAAILGALMVTKIQLAAMSRANIARLEERRPFYLYVDEFQNFATDSFAVILSEARKYGLNLTIANQYVAQMTPIVRDAVFGNVGSLVSFRVGADDATILQKYFEPQFDAQDLIQLHNRHLVAALSISGEKTPAFSATTLDIPSPQIDHSQNIIEHSRKKFARSRSEVEEHIKRTTLSTHNKVGDSSSIPKRKADQHRNPHKNNKIRENTTQIKKSGTIIQETEIKLR
ncbi:DUF87 domain-containing protein [Candidatus Saccharibacteria bacterium CPR2]|nr:DUF87 domain-containing protein [Candidatus Saccharibacteria bacterium CPR2]